MHQSSKGYSKEQRLTKQSSLTDETMLTIQRRTFATSQMQKDNSGCFHLGSLVETEVGLVSVSVLSIGRNVDRANKCARDAEQDLKLDPGTVSILLNYDFRNPSHYVPGSIAGRIALYNGIAYKLIPLLRNHHELGKASWHIIMEDDCKLALTGDDLVNQLAKKFSDADLCFLGYFSKKNNKAPPAYGTQMWAVRAEYCMELVNDMKETKPNDTDMYFMRKAPGSNTAAAPAPIAGQQGHQPDCNTHGKYADERTVRPQAVCDLTKVTPEPTLRETEWTRYVQREPAPSKA